MQKPQISPLQIGEVDSRQGVRGAVGVIARWIGEFIRNIDRFNSEIIVELNPLYGEANYTPAAIANGAQATTTVTVTNAILGYCVEASYNKNLQGLQMTAHISAANTVTIVLKNDTGGSVTLAAGRFRCYVWPRFLSA